MNTRKVLEMGAGKNGRGGTMVISLPKDWAVRNGVVRGGTVVVEEFSPGKLMVQPLHGEPERTNEVTIEYPGENLPQVINDLVGAYLLGYDVIRIQGSQVISREDRQKVGAMIGRLVGLEIMDEDAKGVTVQFLPETSILNPEKIVRRMAKLAAGMLKDMREAAVQRNPKVFALVVERDDEVDRLYFLLVRAIRTATINPELAGKFGLTPVDCLDYRVLASYLESLGDSVSALALSMQNEAPSKVFIRNFDSMLGVLERMEEAAIISFLDRGSRASRGSYLEIQEMQHRVGELSAQTAQLSGVSPKIIVDALSLVEGIAKIFVDISDLSLPTHTFER